MNQVSCRRSTGPARRKRSTSATIARSRRAEHDVDAGHDRPGQVPTERPCRGPGGGLASDRPGWGSPPPRAPGTSEPATSGAGDPPPAVGRQRARRGTAGRRRRGSRSAARRSPRTRSTQATQMGPPDDDERAAATSLRREGQTRPRTTPSRRGWPAAGRRSGPRPRGMPAKPSALTAPSSSPPGRPRPGSGAASAARRLRAIRPSETAQSTHGGRPPESARRSRLLPPGPGTRGARRRRGWARPWRRRCRAGRAVTSSRSTWSRSRAAKASTARAASYRARSNRRSTAACSRRRAGLNTAATARVEPATASVELPVSGSSNGRSSATTRR